MPLRALSIAAAGGRAMMRKVDTIANNLSNVATAGFKRTRASFADLLYQQVQRAGPPDTAATPTGIFFGTGVRLVSTEKIHTQGALEATERQLDFAVDGEGFFRVQLPGGQIAFTRAGNFQLDAQGNLVTNEGYLLDPQFTVPQDATGIIVDVTGRFFVVTAANPETPTEIGQFQLARFVNPSGLEAIGDNLYIQSAASGNPIDGQAGDRNQGFGVIRQGFLEESNVDVVGELVDLIQTQRAFEINTNSIQAADEILQTINGLRR
jgi:flagellar basal-body rod protein FlgG